MIYWSTEGFQTQLKICSRPAIISKHKLLHIDIIDHTVMLDNEWKPGIQINIFSTSTYCAVAQKNYKVTHTP